MNHDLLDPHRVIAWDMDHTLVNGPNSTFLRNYIAANPDRTHHIVTFRTGLGRIREGQSWAQDCLDELGAHGLDPALITSVQSVPDVLYWAYAQRNSFPQPALVDQYIRWKGMTAAQLGATALVDDMEAQCIHGCTEHGVTFINSYDVLFGHLDADADPVHWAEEV